MKLGPSSLFQTVERGTQVFAVLHLIAIPIILYWAYSEWQTAYYYSLTKSLYKPPGGVTFLMQIYIALSGAIFWAAVAAGFAFAKERFSESRRSQPNND